MKKQSLILLVVILSLALCLGLTACGDKIAEQLQNEIGAILEGGGFEKGSVLNFDKVDTASETADDIFEKLGEIGITITDESKAIIYDISVTKDDKEVQPNGKVKVTVPMPQDGTETDYAVYHVKDDGAAEKIPSTYADGKLTFETDGFSYYVFVATSYVEDSTSIGKVQYQLTINVEPANGGHIEINGEEKDASSGIFLNSGEFYSLQAIENEGWVFVGWYDGDELLAEDNVYSHYLNKGCHLVAKFKETPYTLNLTQTEGGLMSLNGESIPSQIASESIDRNASVTLQASTWESYEFIGWYNSADSALLSDSATYTFTMDGDKSIEARFKHLPVGVSVDMTPEGAGYFELADGTTCTKIDEQMEVGTNFTIRVVENFGYKFLHWKDMDTNVVYELEECTISVTENGVNYRAVFEELPNRLVVTATDGGKISATVNGETSDGSFVTEYKNAFRIFTKVELRAEEDVGGYRFVGWYDEDGKLINSDYTYTVSVDGEVTLEARFEKIVEYTVTATAGEGGIVTEGYADGVSIESGTSVTISATPNNGYHFVGWFAGETKVSDEMRYTFTVSEDTTLVAKFEKNIEYTVTATAGEGGTITDGYANGAKVEKGTSVTLTATPNKNYHFIGWFSGETKVYDNANYTFTVNANTTLVAKFEKDPPVKVSITIAPEGAGYFVLADGTTCTKIDEQMEVGTNFTIRVVENFGYKFLHWEDMDTNETYHYGYGERTISVTENGVNYRAVFEELPNRLVVTATDGGKISATVNGETSDGSFVTEYKNAFRNITSVELNAQVGVGGYRFIGWYDGDGKLLNSGFDYTVSVDGEVTVVAKFEKIVEYTVTATAGEGGTVTEGYENGKKVEKGTSETISATPNNGYHFVGWFAGETKVSDEMRYTFTVSEDTTLVAKFEKIVEYTVTATAGEGGIVTEGYENGKKVEKGTSETISATPNNGYHFVGWFAGETKVSDEMRYTFTVNEDTTLVATFEKDAPIEYTVTATAGEGGIVTEGYENGKKVENGTSVTLTATASDHYDFIGWFVGETEVSVNESYTFTVNEDITLVAKFRKNTYRFLCDMQGNGSIWENNANATETYMYGATLSAGTKITLTAKPDTYWQFKGWYTSDGETLISADATYIFELTDHTIICAKFEEKIMYNFLAQCDPYDGGYILEDGQTVDFGNGRMVEPGTEIILSAMAYEGYEFNGWYNGADDRLISSEARYTFTVNESVYVYAKFENVIYNFIASPEPYGGGHIEENGQMVEFGNGRQVTAGTKIKLTAVAYESYTFKGWGTRDDNWEMSIFSTEETYEFTVTENTYVYAVFEAKVTALELDAMNAGFTYEYPEEGDPVIADKTIVQIGAEFTPNPEYVVVYGIKSGEKVYLTKDADYTIDLGGLDFTQAGVYTITYTYKNDPSVTATLTVEVVEKPADGSLTEDEWNAAISYWEQQTNIKVFERTVTSQSYDQQYGSMGAQIMIYQLAGTAYSYDGYMEDDELSQQYKGKMLYIAKIDGRYYTVQWYEEWNSDLQEYTGKWVKEDYFAEDQYNDALSNNIYACGDVDFNYANFTFDTETKSYKNSDGDIAIAFTFDDSGVLTKIVVTMVVTWESGGGYTSVTTITFGDAVVDIPTDTKCSFAIGVKTEDAWNDDVGYITENGEKVAYWYDYFNDGTVLTLTAVANDGYVFKHWAKEQFVDGAYVWVTYSTEATYQVTVDGEYGALYAVFEKVEAES